MKRLKVCTSPACRYAPAYNTLSPGQVPNSTSAVSVGEASTFTVRMLQSDHGAEFSKHFSKQLLAHDIAHRHIHVRSPAENGHLERFNRTIQEECLNRIPKTLKAYRKAIPEYLEFYNTERPHMGLEMLTPLKVMQSY
ncbi:hypothetical protein CO157_00795 [Candidatus Peregrinibacteria bacterium CG_4_9_14_3_um_filter_49_12]|nr:MAG: hypothetical protein CO157_00795 [Candidatus Peregrinibacteria bacterium CG_4_9_14_3_um_filter_49_12]